MHGSSSTNRISFMIELAAILACLALAVATFGQDTSSTTSQNGQPTVTTQVQSAKVVYVSGNDLVVKADDGQVKHFVVPDDFKFSVNGQDLTIHQLTPGMRLTRTITTTSTPRTVTTVRTIHGTVWYVNPPSMVILRMPDNTNKEYKIPDGQKFTVNGEERDAFHLRKGMKVTATVITESPEVVETVTRTVTGQAPPPPPATPTMVGALLIAVPLSAADEQAAEQSTPAVAQNTLPKTASELPLVGLLGLLCLGAGFALRSRRV